MAGDLPQYVFVEDPQQCVNIAAEASEVEQCAMEADRAGRASEAVEGYRRAAAGLREASERCPEGHPDQEVLERHAVEVLSRAFYLEAEGGVAGTVPLEEHIRCAQLTLGSPPELCQELEPVVSASRRTPSLAKVMGAAAIVSGGAGLLIVGPIAGAAIGAATAYATTREDKAGSAARTVGRVGVQLAHQAKTIEKEHKISQRVVSLSFSATGKAKRAVGWGLSSARRALRGAAK